MQHFAACGRKKCRHFRRKKKQKIIKENIQMQGTQFCQAFITKNNSLCAWVVYILVTFRCFVKKPRLILASFRLI